MQEHFGRFGEMVKCKLVTHEDGLSQRHGFVRYAKKSDAEAVDIFHQNKPGGMSVIREYGPGELQEINEKKAQESILYIQDTRGKSQGELTSYFQNVVNCTVRFCEVSNGRAWLKFSNPEEDSAAMNAGNFQVGGMKSQKLF